MTRPTNCQAPVASAPASIILKKKKYAESPPHYLNGRNFKTAQFFKKTFIADVIFRK